MGSSVENFFPTPLFRCQNRFIPHIFAEFAVLLWETLLYNRLTKENTERGPHHERKNKTTA